MDTLKQAQRELYEAEEAYNTSEAKDGNSFYREQSEKHYRQAAIYAAVAQAEQLKRVADNMERWLSIQGVEMEFFEAQNRWKNEQANREADEAAADYLDNRIRAHERMDGLRRGMGLDTD